MKQVLWQILKEVSFNILLLGWSLVYGLVSLPLMLLLPQRKIVSLNKPWAQGIMLLLKLIHNITYEVRNKHNLPSTENYIVASKHQSALDTILLCIIIPHPTFIIKKQLIYLPFIGWYLYFSGMIAIERSQGIAALKKIITKAKISIANFRPLIIFPEGTRVALGHKVEYKSGVVALYTALNAPLIPIALNSALVWGPKIFSFKKQGKVIIEILPAIERGFSKSEMIEQLTTIIETKTAQLCNTQ